MNQGPKYTFEQLNQLIGLTQHFRGEDLKEIEVSQEVMDWFDAQRKNVAKNFSIPTTKNYEKPIYMGVELKCALKLKTK